MGLQPPPLGHAEPEALRSQTGRHTKSTQTAPGWQSSGSVVHPVPTFLSCVVPQSHTVLSLLTIPVSPAMKTQLKPVRAVVQLAAPAGLQPSVGGAQR